MSDPERWLLTHEAPPRILERAMKQEPPRKPGAAGVLRLAVAAVALVALGGGLGWVAHGSLAPDGAGVLVASGESAPVPVRLVIHAPDAHHVSVAGTFNGWDPAATPLLRGSEGTFYIVLPLAPGRYEYMFVLDGERWVPDPAATLTQPDEFGARNGILDV